MVGVLYVVDIQLKLWDVRATKPVREYKGHHNEHAYLPIHVNEAEGLLLAGEPSAVSHASCNAQRNAQRTLEELVHSFNVRVSRYMILSTLHTVLYVRIGQDLICTQ